MDVSYNYSLEVLPGDVTRIAFSFTFYIRCTSISRFCILPFFSLFLHIFTSWYRRYDLQMVHYIIIIVIVIIVIIIIINHCFVRLLNLISYPEERSSCLIPGRRAMKFIVNNEVNSYLQLINAIYDTVLLYNHILSKFSCFLLLISGKRRSSRKQPQHNISKHMSLNSLRIATSDYSCW
jgi:hypothetical protein